MNLINQFPEIHVFFKNDKFSHEQLINLYAEIKHKYKDIVIYRSAITLIKLELLKFQLLGFNKPDETPQQKPAQNLTQSTESNPENKSLSSLAKMLGISPKYLITLLSQKDIKKTENEFLNSYDMEALQPFLISRQKANRREEKKRTILQAMNYRKAESINPSIDVNGVYDKLALFGQGKLIYIRMK